MSDSRAMRRVASAACLTVLVIGSAAAAQADAVSDFYGNKQIAFTVGFEAGETYDIYARLAAAHLARHIPGTPTIIVRNMPGVGGIKSASYMANQAPKDGTAIGMSTQSLALEQALKNPAINFDVRDLSWIGRLAPILQFIVVTQTSPVKTFEQVKETPVILAATSPSGMTYVIPQVLNRLAGSQFKIIAGYAGTSGALLAFERHEVEAATMTVTNLLIDKADWLTEKRISVLVSNTDERYHNLPDVPSMVEVGKGPEEKQILALYSSTAKLGRAIMAPPKIPADRLAALRKAFDDMTRDPEFVAEVQKRKLVEFEPMSGEELQKSIATVLDISPAAMERAIKAKAQ